MPNFNPLFNNNTDLDYYKLGIVFAKITADKCDLFYSYQRWG